MMKKMFAAAVITVMTMRAALRFSQQPRHRDTAEAVSSSPQQSLFRNASHRMMHWQSQ